MLSIENAKKQAETLATYLLTVGKRVKHTHALEAVARMHGYRTWNIFQSTATSAAVPEEGKTILTHYDLAERFASDSVDHVLLNGVRYDVDYFDSDVLGGYGEIMNGGGDDLELTAVIVKRYDGAGLVWEKFSAGRLSTAVYVVDGSWVLEGGLRMELFSRCRS